TWVFRIAINAALSHLRACAPLPLDAIEDVATFTRSLQTSALVAAEVWRKVGARLDELPPKQRLLVELRPFHHLSFDEIAALCSPGEDAAKQTFPHAVKRLRGLLPVAT